MGHRDSLLVARQYTTRKCRSRNAHAKPLPLTLRSSALIGSWRFLYFRVHMDGKTPIPRTCTAASRNSRLRKLESRPGHGTDTAECIQRTGIGGDDGARTREL